MKPGDLVRVVERVMIHGINIGDLAILTKIDWDHRSNPGGMAWRHANGSRITGRGYFFFPNKPEIQKKWQSPGEPLGLLLLFNSFEVISEAA